MCDSISSGCSTPSFSAPAPSTETAGSVAYTSPSPSLFTSTPETAGSIASSGTGSIFIA